MKVSKAMAASHRAALLAAASRLFREKGFDKAGIAEIAAAAGLTHGAFYTHFDSKEALCAAAVEAMTRASAAGVAAAADFDSYLDAYFCSAHLRARGEGCPFAALAGDAVREGPEVRQAMAEGIECIVAALAAARGEGAGKRARAAAIADLATMVGGLLLARGAEPSGLAAEIMAAARATLGARSPVKPARARA